MNSAQNLRNILLVAVALATVGPTASIAGICIESDTTCNHYFLSVDPGEDGLRDLAAYEYGCGANDRSATGVLRTEDGNHYVGLSGSNGSIADTGQIVQWNYVISQATLAGTYEATFSYISGGAPAGHGATGTVTTFVCSDPGVAARAIGTDASLAP